ncbi:MAG: hypothetical protein FP814_07345 [Desulfobacterium sp.]|nr:hypothetical protein [Desulfobacterium sp.]MBU3947474.1 hypothetical protein [Pseudomonadota bacterium]MBU4036973.1 hypothetical protein [Pseudomonadota bacterium]
MAHKFQDDHHLNANLLLHQKASAGRGRAKLKIRIALASGEFIVLGYEVDKKWKQINFGLERF